MAGPWGRLSKNALVRNSRTQKRRPPTVQQVKNVVDLPETAHHDLIDVLRGGACALERCARGGGAEFVGQHTLQRAA